MKTKWYLFILCSVSLLIRLSSAVDTHDSPFTKRKRAFQLGAPKSKPIKLPIAKDRNSSRRLPAGTTAPPRLGHRRSYPTPSPVTLMRPGKPEAKFQSDFASLPDVSVTCSTSDFVVRVKAAFYGQGADAEELTLGGSCKSNGLLRPYGDLLFAYPLTACDGVREFPHGYLVYKFVLHYEPSPKRFPSRAHRMDVGIECRYPRNHHVRQVAVQPTWETAVFRKRLKGLPREYRITLMDESWSRPANSLVYQLGQKINIQVSAPYLPAGGRLYISSCYASPSSGSSSSLKYPIIDNLGCMLDSKQDLGGSQFISRTDKTLRLSLSAFQFTADPNTEVSIHCKISVTSEDPGPAHKSCTYKGNKWRALTGDDSICECCESQCVTPKLRRAMMEGSTSSGSLLVSDKPHTTEHVFQPVSTLLVSLTKEHETIKNHYLDETGSHKKFWGSVDEVNYDGEEKREGIAPEVVIEPNLDEFRERVSKDKWNESELYEENDLEERDEGSENEVSVIEQVIHLNQMAGEVINHRVQLDQMSQSEVGVQRREKPPDSKDEKDKRHEGRDERMMVPEVKWKTNSSLVQMEDDGEMTWYFFWR